MCTIAFCVFAFRWPLGLRKIRKEATTMSLLEITGLTHAYGDTMLYHNAQVSLNKGEHMGIVGQNGTGKSTLIQICTGQVIPDAGRIVWQPNCTVGYLDQYANLDPAATVRKVLQGAFASLYEMEDQMLDCYEKAANGATAALAQAAKLQDQLDRHDFYSIDTRIQQVALGLGLLALGLERPIGQMSGGQRAKVLLAKMLLAKPEVLLLDEPTNFLDKEHVNWLAQYLSGLENAYMVVSHDYEFLDKIANRICDIDNQTITKYFGPYSTFVEKKTALRTDYVRQYAAQQREIKKTEAFIRKNIAGRNAKMARGRQKQLDRLEKLDALDQKELTPTFAFSQLPLPDTDQLRVKALAVGYHYPILSHIDFHVKGGQKVVLTGFNGIGKSTLLKTLVGQIPALSGGHVFSPPVKLGYFAQDLLWPDPSRTPLQLLSDAYPHMTEKDRRKHLAQCVITSKHAMQPIATLSGGEQAKVKLCLLVLRPCNFLIMDEPTNHLDAGAKQALQVALQKFSGSVLLVSHEEGFYRDWAHRVLDITP